MKRFRLAAAFVIALLLITMSFVTVGAQAPELKIPNPTAEFYSNDFANVIDDSTENDIVNMGESTFKATDGGQVVFVSIDSLNGATIEEYANALFNKWKIGTKDKGILFIISMKDRESRIEVGYGYEGVLTDLQSSKLLEKFSEVNQAKGMDEAVKTIYADISSIVRGDGDSVQYPEQNNWSRQQTSSNDNFFSEHPIMSLILIGIIVLMIILDLILTGGRVTFFILRMLAYSARRGGGGGFGGGGGGRNSGGGGRSGGGGASGRF